MKGIFFSVMIVVLGLVLLSSAVLISLSGFREQDIVSRIVVFNRMQDEIEYISREMTTIMNIFNITAIVDGKTVSITENNPFPNVRGFELDMENWKNFTESNSDFTLTLDITEAKNTLPLKINNKVEYRHTNGLSGNKVTVENASVVNNYTVFILVNSDGNIKFDWGSIQAGSQNFTLIVKTNTKTDSTSKLLNFSKGSDLEVEIKLPSGGDKIIDLAIGKGADPGFLKIDNKDRLATIITTNITLDTTEEIEVTLPGSTINIRSNQYNISRVGAVKVT